MTTTRSNIGQARLIAGVCAVDVTPQESAFLYGYPHLARYSAGVNDPLLASALNLSASGESVVFISVDAIWLSKSLVQSARLQVEQACGVDASRIMITATHTHSGPTTVPMLSNIDDSTVPPPSQDYLDILLDGIVAAAVSAVRIAEPAEVALVETNCPGIGSNRNDPAGATIDTIPVLAVRALHEPQRWLGVMYVNRVHPTVLHEDSRLISGDFPGLCRQYLQSHVVGLTCPVLSHLGAAGNQSPRHVTRANTLAEARRLGVMLGQSIQSALKLASFIDDLEIHVLTASTELPLRVMPTVESATLNLLRAQDYSADLQVRGAARADVRTAKCAVFGAEETLALAKVAASGELARAASLCMPAEVQIVSIGPWRFVGWPGEVFAEFAIELKQTFANTHVITLANGELQGYLVTADAVANNTYEASNAIFASPESGQVLLDVTSNLLEQVRFADRPRIVGHSVKP